MTTFWSAVAALAFGVALTQCSWKNLASLLPLALGSIFFGYSPLWLIPALLLWTAPALWWRWRRERHLAEVEAALPGACEAMASGLRAGLSLESAWQTAFENAPPALSPLGTTVRRGLALGFTLEAALSQQATALESEFLEGIARALDLARQTGLDGGKLLTDLAEESRSDAAAADRLRSLTAQGRLQAWVLGAMPVVLLAILATLEPVRVERFLQDPRGRVLLVFAVALETLAIFWIRRLVR